MLRTYHPKHRSAEGWPCVREIHLRDLRSWDEVLAAVGYTAEAESEYGLVAKKKMTNSVKVILQVVMTFTLYLAKQTLYKGEIQ